MIDERIKLLKGSLETCKNMINTGQLNEYSTALYKSEITCTENELQWIEELKELFNDNLETLYFELGNVDTLFRKEEFDNARVTFDEAFETFNDLKKDLLGK